MNYPLVINQHHQFKQSSVGQCSRAFISEMKCTEWTPYVYASDRDMLEKPIPEYVRIIHERKYWTYLDKVVRHFILPDLFFLPGYEWQAWGNKASKRIIKDIKKGEINPNYIHSISFSCANHWAALKVKKATGLPWIMQLYDPWADNPYRTFKTDFFKRKDWKQEQLAVENADLIIHTNEVIAELWRKRYGEKIGEKIEVLPLTSPVFNTKVTPISYDGNRKLIISYIGSLTLNRTLKPFVDALCNLIEKKPEIRDKIIVNIVGPMYDSEKSYISVNKMDSVFNYVGVISPEECDKYYNDSDIFLAVDGVNPDNFFFPSKIIKYFYFQRPILGITPQGSVLDFELKSAHHISIDNHNVKGITEYLQSAICNYSSLCNFDNDYYMRFSSENVMKKYSSLVSGLLSKKGINK